MARFLIVEARFYDHLNDLLIAGAKACLLYTSPSPRDRG